MNTFKGIKIHTTKWLAPNEILVGTGAEGKQIQEIKEIKDLLQKNITDAYRIPFVDYTTFPRPQSSYISKLEEDLASKGILEIFLNPSMKSKSDSRFTTVEDLLNSLTKTFYSDRDFVIGKGQPIYPVIANRWVTPVADPVSFGVVKKSYWSVYVQPERETTRSWKILSGQTFQMTGELRDSFERHSIRTFAPTIFVVLPTPIQENNDEVSIGFIVSTKHLIEV